MAGTTVDKNYHLPPSLCGTSAPLIIIFLGAPGSGKGTHAPALGAYLNIPHISTGNLLRENIRDQSPIGQKAQILIDQGELVPDEIVLSMLFERLTHPDCTRGAILDGVPRTIVQAEALEQKLGSSHRFMTLLLSIDPKLLIERICGRIVCEECGKSYHKKFNPPKGSVCNCCKGPLFQRPDDTKETLKNRLQIYQDQTEPLIKYYKAKPGVLHKINGNQTKRKVFNEIILSIVENK